MTDPTPDFPPHPDEHVVQPRSGLQLTADQVRFAADFVANEPDAVAIRIEGGEPGFFSAIVLDAMGETIDVRTISPLDNKL